MICMSVWNPCQGLGRVWGWTHTVLWTGSACWYCLAWCLRTLNTASAKSSAIDSFDKPGTAERARQTHTQLFARDACTRRGPALIAIDYANYLLPPPNVQNPDKVFLITATAVALGRGRQGVNDCLRCSLTPWQAHRWAPLLLPSLTPKSYWWCVTESQIHFLGERLSGMQELLFSVNIM